MYRKLSERERRAGWDFIDLRLLACCTVMGLVRFPKVQCYGLVSLKFLASLFAGDNRDENVVGTNDTWSVCTSCAVKARQGLIWLIKAQDFLCWSPPTCSLIRDSEALPPEGSSSVLDVERL